MLDFDKIYKSFRLLFQNPDSSDVLSFMWVYEQVEMGKDMNELSEEIQKNQNITGYAYPEEYSDQILSKKKRIIAECIATAGYGTNYYDPETGDCTHECYASVDKVIKNESYWNVYEGGMSNPLNIDFELGFNFNRYHLIVYSDGTKETKEYEGK